MVGRNHACEYPGCIQPAVETCVKCFAWFCGTHKGKGHNCEEIDAWNKASPLLNNLSPEEIMRGPVNDMPGPEKPTKKDWRTAVER